MTTIPPEEIKTARLVLEPLRIDHAEEMGAVLANQRLYSFIGGQPPTKSELAYTYAQQVVGSSPDGSQRWLNWVVREADSGTATGYVQATVTGAQRDATAWIAWVIGVRQQGRGYATEAASAMVGWLRSHGVHRMVADVHPEHHASMAVARRLGLAPTGEVVEGEVRWASG